MKREAFRMEIKSGALWVDIAEQGQIRESVDLVVVLGPGGICFLVGDSATESQDLEIVEFQSLRIQLDVAKLWVQIVAEDKLDIDGDFGGALVPPEDHARKLGLVDLRDLGTDFQRRPLVGGWRGFDLIHRLPDFQNFRRLLGNFRWFFFTVFDLLESLAGRDVWRRSFFSYFFAAETPGGFESPDVADSREVAMLRQVHSDQNALNVVTAIGYEGEGVNWLAWNKKKKETIAKMRK